MERLLKGIILQIILSFTLKIHNICCQHNQQAASVLPPFHQEFPKEYLNSNNPSPTPQLMNTLLTIAAANGVLPELLPKIQPLQILDTPYSQQDVDRNIVSQMHQPIPHALPIPTEFHAVGYEAVPRPMPIVPPIVISPGLNTQPINPFIPLELQHQSVYKPKEEKCFCSDNIVSTPSSPPSLPVINVNTFDTSRLSVEQCANSILTTENGVQYPVNLQISVPPPNVEAPRITLINAALPTGSRASADVNSASYNNWFPYGYATQPQVIVKKRKSSLRDWLPLLIYSMLNKDRGGCRNGCCCSCKSQRSGTVPIPFPIPIPTNSPIIGTGYSFQNTSSHNSTKNENRHCND